MINRILGYLWLPCAAVFICVLLVGFVAIVAAHQYGKLILFGLILLGAFIFIGFIGKEPADAFGWFKSKEKK